MDATETFTSELSSGEIERADWVLIAALDCERLSAVPLRIRLTNATALEIGRGSAREVSSAGARMRLDLPDRWASQRHACLARDDDGWTVEDVGSKNGTRVNGTLITRARLDDGDVLEVGGTFLILRQVRGERVIAAGPARLDRLETMSPALERELAVLAKVARSRVPVLVRGESGSGKELVSRAVHAVSGRCGPLVTANCGAIPQTLLEAELFGSRRGAFSGAQDRIGLVRSAEDGTLFLDEVVELPAASQAALLRFLQDGEIAPLGADKRINVDVRIVAATNQAVEDLVAQGKFRRDLYARLCGYVVALPPLAARLEDLGLLVASLFARHDEGGPERQLSRTAARALFLHRWPFNVRELEQALSAALATADGARIGRDDLRLAATLETERGLDAEPTRGTAAPPRTVSRDLIITLLDRHAGNLAAVARDLATSRSQVRRLLARHGLTTNDYKPA